MLVMLVMLVLMMLLGAGDYHRYELQQYTVQKWQPGHSSIRLVLIIESIVTRGHVAALNGVPTEGC
jgi:hypothetical protein